jgi:hypothetical protein
VTPAAPESGAVSSLLVAYIEAIVREQLRRWREVLVETGDERVELLAQDAVLKLEALQDALLIGHFHDALREAAS